MKDFGEKSKRYYPQKNYVNKLGIQELIVFGIYSVIKNGEICTFERLVAECFNLFPEVFAFKRYPQWPDSLKFDRPLRTLREKGLIVGIARDHFELTEFGIKEANKISMILEGRSSIRDSKRKKGIRSIDDKLIEYIKETQAFKNFTKNPEKFVISEAEFRNVLRCTLETPFRIVKQNLQYYKKVAIQYREKEIERFLKYCEKKFVKEKDG